MKDQPLGPIISKTDIEAICRPNKKVMGKGRDVIDINSNMVGNLGDPIGPVRHPYAVIKLKKNSNVKVGDLLIAKKYNKNKKNKKFRR